MTLLSRVQIHVRRSHTLRSVSSIIIATPICFYKKIVNKEEQLLFVFITCYIAHYARFFAMKIFVIILQDGYYHSHFTDEKTESQEG